MKLTPNHRDMVRQLYPAGEADTFVRHIMRVFDTDGNDFLDFKEFLMAMDISNCQTSIEKDLFPSKNQNYRCRLSIIANFLFIIAEAKLNWAFKLYDVNNDGVIDLKEMAVIIEMMDNLDGVIPGINYEIEQIFAGCYFPLLSSTPSKD